MRPAALVSTAVVLGAFAGVAQAAGLPAPTPTLPLPPPLPAPALPIPTLPTPSLPIPSPPVRVSTPTVANVPQSPLSVAGVASAPSPSSSAGGSGGSGSGYPAPSHRSSISGLHSTRPWLATSGLQSRRTTILSFRLARGARVDFAVLEVFPVCRVAGSFAVGGHAGLNRVRFNGKVHGRQLVPGTYRISARMHGGGARLLHVIVVIVGMGVPTPAQIRAARRSDGCGTARALAASAESSGGGFATTSPALPASHESVIVRHQNPNGGARRGRPSAAPFSPERVSKNAANPLVVAAFAVAVLLLGLAALSQRAVPDPRLNDVLTRHRVEVALTGAAAFAGALLALALA